MIFSCDDLKQLHEKLGGKIDRTSLVIAAITEEYSYDELLSKLKEKFKNK